MPYVRDIKRLYPDVDTTWGQYTNPHIQFDPEEYASREFPLPQQMQGQGMIPRPRPLGPGVKYLGAVDPAGGVDRTTLIIACIVVGLVAYFLGRSSASAKRNPRSPRRRRRRAPARRALAAAQPRNELGQFV